MLSNHIPRPFKILHVVHSLNCGGIETWILQLLRNVDMKKFQIDIMVRTPSKGFYDDEAISLGAKILRCTNYRNLPMFRKNFRELILENGPYDIIHSHLNYWSGIFLREAKRCGIKFRIAHSHTDHSYTQNKDRIIFRFFFPLLKLWMAKLIQKYATHGVACSYKAGVSFFISPRPPWFFLPCGIDLSSFKCPINRSEIKSSLGITDSAFVVGHVGSFSEAKNHEFLIRVFRKIVEKNSQARLVLVGSGPLKEMVKHKVNQFDLQEKVIFTGFRSDVANIMKGVIDVLVFPSFFEGMPLVALEAQAAGLPCILSDVISKETDVIPELVIRHNLEQDPNVWADSVLRLENMQNISIKQQALSIVEQSQFNIVNSSKMLFQFYQEIINSSE